MATAEFTGMASGGNPPEHPFIRYVRATLAAALGEQQDSYLLLRSISSRDNLMLSASITEAFQWRLLYCRARQEPAEPKQKPRRSLLCIGEAVGPDLRDAMLSAGIGTIFTMVCKSEYRRVESLNRSEQVFDPLSSPIQWQHTITPSAPQPDWGAFEEQMASLFVLTAMKR